MKTALAKVSAVLAHDAAQGIQHKRLEVEPAFYRQLAAELEAMRFIPPPPIGPDGRPESPWPPKPFGMERIAVCASYGLVDVVPKEAP